MPVAARRRLVVGEPVVDAERHLVERLGHGDVGGSAVHRVRAEDHQELDLARLHLGDEAGERVRLAAGFVSAGTV